MATDLFMITNTKLSGNENTETWENILSELKKLKLSNTRFINDKHQLEYHTGDWEYEINDTITPPNVDFWGPFVFSPTLYKNISVIFTIYKYRNLYEFYEFEWLDNFRSELFQILKVIGGTEVIYLADNGCDKLSTYLELMAWEDVSYEVIKEKMIEQFGLPKTDYSKLSFPMLDYSNITEFVLDDFQDLKDKSSIPD
jgi:hypothetical protein